MSSDGPRMGKGRRPIPGAAAVQRTAPAAAPAGQLAAGRATAGDREAVIGDGRGSAPAAIAGQARRGQADPHPLLDLPGVAPDPRLAAALTALAAVREDGHTGAPLAELAAAAGCAPAELAALLCRDLAQPLTAGAADPGDRPLVVAGDWVASRRAWAHEAALAAELLRRAGDDRLAGLRRDPAIADDLRQWFPPRGDGLDRQRLAAATALARGLALITGGPGRGKTWVAGAIVAILTASRARRAQPPPVVCLCAPTGKAAARLRASLVAARPELAALAAWTSTLHHLRGDPRAAGLDLLIVDEVSMADAAILRQAVAAIPGDARLVLLGDPDQLASVDPGRVLADLAAWGEGACDPALAAWYADAFPGETPPTAPAPHPLARVRVHLTRNHRSAGTPVAVLAEACQGGDPLAVLAADAAADHAGAWAVRADPPADPVAALIARGEAPIAAVLAAATPAEALAAHARWLVLAALRRGPYGAPALAAGIERRLHADGRIAPDRAGHYSGRPILVTRNQPGAGLANGDLGVAWPGAAGWDLVLDDGSRRPLAQVAAWEPAWAVTVHKAQGSQAPQVEVIGPGGDGEHPLLTREWLYTAITRARERVRLWLTPAQIAAAQRRRTQRRSGLGLALAAAPG